jgi:hypothetical protein
MAKPSASKDLSAPGIKVAVKPYGPTSEELAAIGERVVLNPALLDYIGHSKARLLYVEALEEDDPVKSGKPKPPRAFRPRTSSMHACRLETRFAAGEMGR